MHTPTRLLSSTRSIIWAICSNEYPRFEPCPAVHSITAFTPEVCSSARFIESAIRFRQSSTGICFRWLPGWKFSIVRPSCMQRFSSSRNAARDNCSFSLSGEPRLIRYPSWGNMYSGRYPVSVQRCLKRSASLSDMGFAVQREGLRVNRAKALAPMFWALTGADATPPPTLTCAPMYLFDLSMWLIGCLICSKDTQMSCERGRK